MSTNMKAFYDKVVSTDGNVLDYKHFKKVLLVGSWMLFLRWKGKLPQILPEVIFEVADMWKP